MSVHGRGGEASGGLPEPGGECPPEGARARLDDAERLALVWAYVEESCRVQGLPARVRDRRALREVAELLLGGRGG